MLVAVSYWVNVVRLHSVLTDSIQKLLAMDGYLVRNQMTSYTGRYVPH